MQQTSFPYYSMTPTPAAMVIESTTPPQHDALLLDRIRTQVEYYFSENNLSRDSYLQSYLMNPEHYGLVPVSVIADFPKLRSIQATYYAGHHVPATNAPPVNPWLIYEALRFSHIVRVSVDGRFLSRLPTAEHGLMNAAPPYHGLQAANSKSNATSPTSFESSSDASHTLKERLTIKLTAIPEELEAPDIWDIFSTASAKPSGVRYDEKENTYSVYFETEDLATVALATFQTTVIGNAAFESVNAELTVESTPVTTPTKEQQQQHHQQNPPVMLPAIAVESAVAYPPPIHALPVQSFPAHLTPTGYYPYGFAFMPPSAASMYDQQQHGFVAIGPLYTAPGAAFPNHPAPSIHQQQTQQHFQHHHRPPNQIYVKPTKKASPSETVQASPIAPHQRQPQQQQQQQHQKQQRPASQNSNTVTKKVVRRGHQGTRTSSSAQQQQRTTSNGGSKTAGNRGGKKNQHSNKKESGGGGGGGGIALVEADFPALRGTSNSNTNNSTATSSNNTTASKKAAYAEAVKSKKAASPLSSSPPSKPTTTSDLYKKMNKLEIAGMGDSKAEKPMPQNAS